MRKAAVPLLALFLAACDSGPKTPPDPYADPELKSPPPR
jgi:hypothetical protein